MKFYLHTFVALTCFACGSASDSQDTPDRLRLFAASSLATAVPQIAEAFEKEHPGTTIEYSFSSSSILAKQIAYGADADLYLAANLEWMDYLESRSLLATNLRIDLLRNKLVLVVPQGREDITNMTALRTEVVKRIAIGDWTHVPAGMYAKAALEKAGLWQDVKPKCLPALDARAALAYVERGDADCGIVYRSDAKISKRVVVAAELPEQFQPDIRYSAAVTSASRHPLAQAFLLFLQSDQASTVFRKYGFEPL